MDFSEGYEGVTHAGIAVVAADSGRVLLAQRAIDETDAPDVRETWEFPGGSLNPDEDAQAGAMREFIEELGMDLPASEVVHGWRSGADGHYQGFVYLTPVEIDLSEWEPTDEVQAVGWFSAEEAADLPLRPEVRDTDWAMFEVSGNEGVMDEQIAAATQVGTADEYMQVDEAGQAEPEYNSMAMLPGTVYVHGILAPEDAESGDARGFNAGALTRRPLRLPLGWQKFTANAHDKAVTVGSIDRMMRKDGMIHWEGTLLDSEEADEFAGLLAHFGQYGVSIDGDRGNLDAERSHAEGGTWFAGARISGAVAVSIPAFAEAYVSLGAHPDMPEEFGADEDVLAAGGRIAFDRGPGWVTHPTETKRLHDYWTKPGEPGYAKIAWGTPGDFRRARALIGEKIAKNSPTDLRYINQIAAQWHYDALGYWPGELGKPGNPPDTKENRKRAAVHAASEDDAAWEVVLTSSAGVRALPPASYFDRVEDSAALVITDPDEFGIRRTYGYAGEWGVCHIGYSNRCVEIPSDASGQYADYHLGRTKTADSGYLSTGLITYKTEHRDAATILSQSAEQAHYDDISRAWAAVRIGEDDRGVWFSGVVLPHVPEEDIVLIEASGQVSGEWKYGALRGLQCVNIPGFPVQRASAVVDESGEVVALAASAFGNTECEPTPAEKMAALRQADAHARFEALRTGWEG